MGKRTSVAGNSFRDRIVLVTGSGRGIGKATAELFAARGARVVICGRTRREIIAVAAEIQNRHGADRAIAVVADVSRLASIRRLFATVERKFGPVDTLINNAAIGFAIPLQSVDEKTWNLIQSTNVRGAFFCAQLMIRRFPRSAAKRAGRMGSIVNLSSLGGIQGTVKFKGLAPYVISKFGMVGMTEALAVEAREFGIRVNCVAPGAVDTEMLKKAAPHLKTRTKPADIAKVILGLCDDRRMTSITGTVVEVLSNL